MPAIFRGAFWNGLEETLYQMYTILLFFNPVTRLHDSPLHDEWSWSTPAILHFPMLYNPECKIQLQCVQRGKGVYQNLKALLVGAQEKEQNTKKKTQKQTSALLQVTKNQGNQGRGEWDHETLYRIVLGKKKKKSLCPIDYKTVTIRKRLPRCFLKSQPWLPKHETRT